MPPDVATSNGTGPKEAIERKLTGDPLTLGYTPTLPMWAMYTDASYLPQIYILRDIELMVTHPIVKSALEYYKGGLAGLGDEIEVEAQDSQVEEFVTAHCRKFWENGMPKIQGGYEYGWIGVENNYEFRNDLLCWKECLQFSPRDVYLLTQEHKPVGVRVKNVAEKGDVDLWTATEDVPAKGLWYGHNPRHNRYYGQSQILGAWRPWRRLAWKDAAETVTDTGVYRFAYAGPVVYYPDEDLQVEAGPGQRPPGTTLDSQGRPRRFARDIARFIAEQYKAGAGVGLPSENYPPEMGGGPKWKLDLPQSTINVDGLIAYVKYLQDQIWYGVGVPPELQQAAETGSGYSGRKLPLEAFLMQQQKVGNAILELFLDQVLRPLVRWNFGPQALFMAKLPKILKMTRQDATGASTDQNAPQGQQGGPGNNPERPDQVAGPVSLPGTPTPPGVSMSLHDDRVRRIVEAIRRVA